MSGNGLHLFQLPCRACPYRIHVFFRQYFPFYAPPLYFPASNACPAPSSSPPSIPPSPPYSPAPLISPIVLLLLWSRSFSGPHLLYSFHSPFAPPLSLSSSLVLYLHSPFISIPKTLSTPVRPHPQAPQQATSSSRSQTTFFLLGKRGNAGVKKWEVGEEIGEGMRFGKGWRNCRGWK